VQDAVYGFEEDSKPEPNGIDARSSFSKSDFRSVPRVKASTPTIAAIWSLLSSKIEALPLEQAKDTSKEFRHARAISGYSIISKLLEGDRLSMLEEPCENSSLTIGSVSLYGDDLVSLLHVFESTTFGYAAVEKLDKEGEPNLIFIKDLLGLYMTGHIASELTVNDVASSPIFSVSASSSLKNILTEMLNRKFRRVLLQGSERQIITDRDILDFLFANRRLEGNAFDMVSLEKALDKEAGIIRPTIARKVSDRDSLRTAAQAILESGNGFVLCPSGLITPWDLIMKPWRLGRLRVKN
jgi:hypothetical protein